MNAAGRLAAYGAGLALVFGGALVAGSVLVPDSAVAGWQQSAKPAHFDEHGADGHASSGEESHAAAVRGVSLSQDGYLLGPVSMPDQVGKPGRLSFTIMDESGRPVTDFGVSHEKQLHLIVVRTDGTLFRHVHPTLDESTGMWSLPWTWQAAGTYRVFADFVPDTADAPSVTLTRVVDVAGDLVPDPVTEVRRSDTVDGYEVRLNGDLRAGESSQLTMEVTKDGQPVTTLEPYLGAFGHLVALRDGDLAYLHVHPEGDSPEPGATGGPTVSFAAEALTSGRYLLYLDFQVGGRVRTATFVLDTTNH